MKKYVSARRRVGKILREFCPDVVIGTGGYVSAPVLSRAARSGYRTLIHEQNAFAGVTTKLLAPRVDRVLLSFPLAHPLKCDAGKCTVVGNPVKAEFRSVECERAREELGIDQNETVVLSYGGSLGARTINDAFVGFARLAAKDGAMTLYHGASRDYARVCEALGEIGDRVHVSEYIYGMPKMMAAADLVVARSGAMTLTELAVLGKPSVLIPSPNVTENHQYFNAKTYSDVGAAVLLEEKDLTGESLYRIVRDLVFDRERMLSMRRAAISLAHPEATDRICDAIEELIER